ncbi:hypothetical protein T190_07600 [Sinorhizobium meliloti CCBAU 01290]|nr:hypothetical protein T190_07600 [Sinorhizobium meliloti CCBAU 01290]
MSAYNPVNGVQAAENQWLLTQVLRQEWGYDGLVVSDWHAIKDRPASLAAGTELDMPESKPRKAQLLAALKTGEIDRQAVDAACGRMLDFVRKCLAANQRARCRPRPTSCACARHCSGVNRSPEERESSAAA